MPESFLDCEHVWHLYVIKTDQRDQLKSYLANNGIPSVINYPTALPFLPAYKRFGHKPNDFPNAFANQSSILSLPMYPELSDEKIDSISEAIHTFFG